MKDSGELILENIIKLTRSSEKKFKLGNFKGALHEKMKANEILKSESCDEKKINKIVKMLECKSEEKLKNLDYRGAIKALRRAEKYKSN